MADPFGGQLLTAGTPGVAVNGDTWANQTPSTQQAYVNQYGGDAPTVWLQDVNNYYIKVGFAQKTPSGVALIQGANVPNSARLYAAQTVAGTSTIIQSCAQCATGQNTGACAGCAPATPPGYVTTGQGPPISTTSGLPFGFRPTSPVSIVGITLPAWIWGAGLAAGYFALRGGRRR